MKKTSLYVVGILLFSGALFACDDEENSVKESDLTARLELTIQGSSVTGNAGSIAQRSHSALPVTSVEGTVNLLTVGVFKTDGSTDVISESTLSSEDTISINATEGTRTILVVANAPEGYFAGVATRDAFVAKALDLEITTPSDAGTADQLSSDLPMTGEATTTSGGSVTSIALQRGTTTAAYVKLTRLVSRVSISKVSYDFPATGLYPDATFTPAELFLYNAKTKTTCTVGTTNPTTTITGQGESSTSANSDYRAYLGDTIDDFTNGSDFTNPYFFYTYANYDTDNATRLVIKGLFDGDGSGSTYSAETVYYPIVINRAQTGTTITNGSGDATIDRNKTYALTVTIKNKGVGSVTDDLEPADVTLTVSVADWALQITQDVTFE